MRNAFVFSIIAVSLYGLGAGANAQQPGTTATGEISAAELQLVRAAEQQRVDAIDRVYGAVVAIYGNDRQGGGSGVLVDSAGYAVTNHHVVAGAGVEGWAGLADGKLYRWKLIGTDPGGDVAVIQLSGQEKFPTAPLGDSGSVRVGDWSMAMGNPFVLADNQRPTVTLGIVSGIERYQPGEGMNQLVYGNCIQVDSSINPGNSGGPLFNIRGEIIGINGRGSFQERGRVNVGLGYAISSNQVKLFLPELLATKIAQHGTLDAQFSNREGGMICHTINIESAAARAGLQLGDRLLTFEDVKIVSANQFTNLITTYPAGWPVKLVVDREQEGGERQQQTIHVRLTALPYEALTKQPAKAEPTPMPPMPQPQQDGEKQPEAPPMPVIVKTPALPLSEAGKIRDGEVNQRIASELLARCRSFEGIKADSDDQKATASQWSWQGKRGDQSTEEYVITLADDGRCVAQHRTGESMTLAGFDGAAYWQQLPGKPAQRISAAKASRNLYLSQALAVAAVRAGKPPAGFQSWRLDGADKAGGELAYRLSATDDEGEQFFLWLSAATNRTIADGPLVLRKSAVGIEDDEPIASVVYAGGDSLIRPQFVRGLAEQSIPAAAEFDVEHFSPGRRIALDEAMFRMPSEVEAREPTAP